MKKENAQDLRRIGKVRKTLEGHYQEIQDLEFTAEKTKLYMLQPETER